MDIPAQLDYETICRIVGHLFIQSRLEIDSLSRQAGEAIAATRSLRARVQELEAKQASGERA